MNWTSFAWGAGALLVVEVIAVLVYLARNFKGV